MSARDSNVPPEQQIYARWLDWGTRVSLAVLTAAFLIYLLGIAPPWVPVAELPNLWTLPVERYLALTQSPVGWDWLGLVAHGDYLNLVGVSLLGLVTVGCYLRVLPLLLARGRLQAAIAAAQVAVLLLAASGVFAGGH